MTILEALNFVAVYPELSSLKMPFKVALKLHKINVQANAAVDFYNDKLKELLEEYAEKDEEGNFKPTETDGIMLKQETAEECKKKLEELQDLQWEDNNVYFVEEEFEELENFNLTPNQVKGIYPFLFYNREKSDE